MKDNIYLYVSIGLTIAIGVGSLSSIAVSRVVPIQNSDKLVHIAAYCLLTLSWLYTYKKRASQIKISIFIAALVLIYGIIIEVFQATLTINRQLELNDIFANFIGIVGAFIFFNTVFQKKQLN